MTKRLRNLAVVAALAVGAAASAYMASGLLVQGASPPVHPPLLPPHHHPHWAPPPPAHPVVVVPTLKPIVFKPVPVPSVTVVKNVTALPAIPEATAEEVAQEKAYQVVGVGRDLTLVLDMDGKKAQVRLLGIAPPEGPKGEQREGMPPISVRFVRSMLQGEFVYLAYDEKLAPKDADGILTVYMYRAPERLFVNLEVVRQGYAVTAEGYSFEYEKTFRTYEEAAQANDRGVWGLIKRAEEAKPAPKP